MKNTKFKVEDEVMLKSNTSVVGVIKQIVSVLAKGNTLYLVNFPHGLKMVPENELEFNREIVEDLSSINLNDLSVAIEVEDRINEIIEELNLTKSTFPATVLINACKLQRYLVLTCSVVKKYVGAKSNNILNNELYNGLIMGDRNYLTNALIFKEIMKKLDANVHTVAMKDSKNKFYVSNLLLIDDDYYYFDVTLDTDVYLEAKEEDEFVLCCAGVGKARYEKYFKPIALLDFDVNVPNKPLPENIAVNDIDLSIIKEIK